MLSLLANPYCFGCCRETVIHYFTLLHHQKVLNWIRSWIILVFFVWFLHCMLQVTLLVTTTLQLCHKQMKKFMNREILPKPTKRTRGWYDPVLKYFDKRWQTIRCIPSIRLDFIVNDFVGRLFYGIPMLISITVFLKWRGCCWSVSRQKRQNYFCATQERFMWGSSRAGVGNLFTN